MYHKTTVLALFIPFIFSNYLYSMIICLVSDLPVPNLSDILWVVCGSITISGPLVRESQKYLNHNVSVFRLFKVGGMCKSRQAVRSDWLNSVARSTSGPETYPDPSRPPSYYSKGTASSDWGTKIYTEMNFRNQHY